MFRSKYRYTYCTVHLCRNVAQSHWQQALEHSSVGLKAQAISSGGCRGGGRSHEDRKPGRAYCKFLVVPLRLYYDQLLSTNSGVRNPPIYY